MKIEQGKFYKLRNGMKYRCYATDGGGNYPNHGAYFTEEIWWIIKHDVNGNLYKNHINGYDIISEWVEPHPAELWPVDAKLMVSDNEVAWYPRYFAKYEDGIFYCWNNGATSFSALNKNDINDWKYAKLMEETK